MMKKLKISLSELNRLNGSILKRWGTLLLIVLIFALAVPAVNAGKDLSPSFTFLPTSPTVGETVTFTGSSNWDNITTWTWNFGDKDIIGTKVQGHTFSSEGQKNVKMTVSAGNATDSFSQTITVKSVATPPVASFSFSPTSPTVNQSVTFTDESTGEGIESWKWVFGNGQESDLEKPPAQIYTSANVYNVSLTVTNVAGDSIPYIRPITVTEPIPLTPSFSISTKSPNIGEVVSFTGSSTTGGIDQWNWEFGDGQYGRGQTQSHAYTTAGTKKVILTVTKGGVTSDPVEQSVTVKLPNPLDADFSFYPENPKTDQNVTFTDKSAGSPDEWEWIFGDNKFAYVKNPSHKYAKDGKYDVKLIITKAGGYSATITKTITVGTVTPTPTIGPEPKAEFKWEPSTPMVGTPVSFTDTSTGGGITEWKWDFDDKMDFTGNRESKLQNPQHTYQYPGVYDVTLFVKNSGGTDIILKKVTVITVPLNARFTASPASGTAPLSVRFVDSSTGTGIKSYQWDFGNGQTYTGKSPSNVVYSSPGTYRVSLEIADENGYKNMYAMNIIANPPATATPPQTTALMATSAPDVEDGGFIGGEYRMMTGLYNEYIRIIFGFLGIADGLDFLMFAVE